MLQGLGFYRHPHGHHRLLCCVLSFRSCVGSKSLNIAKLKSSLPEEVLTPQSAALPFGSLQRTLHAPENAQALKDMSVALRKLSVRMKNSEANAIFEVCRKAVSTLVIPAELCDALEEVLASSAPQGNMDDLNASRLGRRPRLMDLWKKNGDAKCKEVLHEVWSSLFALRPWISLAKASRDYCELNMAVLVQVGHQRAHQGIPIALEATDRSCGVEGS